MIESEEKRKRIDDIVRQWTKNTKVEQYLREYDIPGLVNQIINEFYHINLSCGHWVRQYEGESFDFSHKTWEYDDCYDYDGPFRGSWSTISGNYCRDCYEKMKVDYDDEGYPIDYEVKCPICGQDLLTFPSEGLVNKNMARCSHRVLHEEKEFDLSSYKVVWSKVSIKKNIDGERMGQCPICDRNTFDGQKCFAANCCERGFSE
jgi:hypothetical protein